MKKKFDKHKVFLKFDSVCENNGCSAAYVYLDNKTFINRHLLRTGYVDIDTAHSFEYKNKFEEDILNG